MVEDCRATGFTGEGRCIEPATTSDGLCTTHAQDHLRRASNEALLTVLVQLTHRLHGLSAFAGEAALMADLRAQRDLVRAEVLRRMGGDR